MKTIKLLFVIGLLLPSLSFAQWNMVHFDSVSVFNRAFTATPATVFLTGIESSGGSFLKRSNNGGIQWDSIVINSSGVNYDLRIIFFSDEANGYAGGYKNNTQTLIKTIDNGNTWIDVTPDPSGAFNISALHFIDPLTGFAAAGSTLYKTSDGGNSWNTLSTPVEISSISFPDSNTGIICGTLANDAVVYKTTDGGISWTNVFTTTNPWASPSNIRKSDMISLNEYIVTMDYSNLLFRTIDGGISWDTITVPSVWNVIQDFDFITSSRGRVVSDMGEIFFTNDGGQNWTLEYATSQGAYGPTVMLYSISFNGNTGYVAGTNGLVKKITDETTSVNETGGWDSWNIYPNPVEKNKSVIIDAPDVNVKIYSLTGILVYDSMGTNKNITSIPLQGIAQGMYMVSISGKTGWGMKKLIISGE